jgi:hypothetical protein
MIIRNNEIRNNAPVSDKLMLIIIIIIIIVVVHVLVVIIIIIIIITITTHRTVHMCRGRCRQHSLHRGTALTGCRTVRHLKKLYDAKGHPAGGGGDNLEVHNTGGGKGYTRSLHIYHAFIREGYTLHPHSW